LERQYPDVARVLPVVEFMRQAVEALVSQAIRKLFPEAEDIPPRYSAALPQDELCFDAITW